MGVILNPGQFRWYSPGPSLSCLWDPALPSTVSLLSSTSLPPLPFSPPPVSLQVLQPSPLRFLHLLGEQSSSRCKCPQPPPPWAVLRAGCAQLRRRAERPEKGCWQAPRRRALLCWARLSTGVFPSLCLGCGASLGGRRGAQLHHVSPLSQPLEPGVLCLHGVSGDPGAVGCLLRLRGEQVQHELHVRVPRVPGMALPHLRARTSRAPFRLSRQVGALLATEASLLPPAGQGVLASVTLRPPPRPRSPTSDPRRASPGPSPQSLSFPDPPLLAKRMISLRAQRWAHQISLFWKETASCRVAKADF